MFFTYRELDNSDELQGIMKRQREIGGSIVAYKQTYSLIVFTFTRLVYELVPSSRSAVLVGVKHALISISCWRH